MPTFWTQPTDGIKYVRAELPARYLGGNLLDWDEEIENDDPYANQQGPGVWQLIANPIRLKAMNESPTTSFLEIDDNYLKWDPAFSTMANWAPEATEQPNLNSMETHIKAAKSADGVIVSTPYLAEQYGEYNDNVFVCRNSVDENDWLEPDWDRGPFRIVFAGSIWPEEYELIRKALTWASTQPNVECYLMGSPVPIKGCKNMKWTSAKEYREAIVRLKPDVGLRPIQSTPLARGKSDLKVLEYAMAGALPIVSYAEAYKPWNDSVVKFAHSDKDWQSQLRWAIRHQDEVRTQAFALRERVISERSISVVGEEWAQALLKS